MAHDPSRRGPAILPESPKDKSRRPIITGDGHMSLSEGPTSAPISGPTAGGSRSSTAKPWTATPSPGLADIGAARDAENCTRRF